MMGSRAGAWSAASRNTNSDMQTSNSQYGQWFNDTRPTSFSAAPRHFNVTSASRQYDHPRDQLSASRDQLAASRDYQPAMTSSSYNSWRPAASTLPLFLQRSHTTLGPLSTSGCGADASGMTSQSHEELLRDYRRYRQLQASIAGEQTWRGTSRLLARPTATGGGTASAQSLNTTTSNDASTLMSSSAATEQQQEHLQQHQQQHLQRQKQHQEHQQHWQHLQPQQQRTETTTVVPIQLPQGIAGPLPLQRSVGNVVSAASASCRLPTDITLRRGSGAQTAPVAYAATRLQPSPSSSSPFVQTDTNTTPAASLTNDAICQLNSVAQVRLATRN